MIWGDKDCEHRWGSRLAAKAKIGHGTGGSTLTGGHNSWGDRDGGSQGQFCSLCSAWRGAYGLEPTPDCGRLTGKLCNSCYVCHTLVFLRAIRRVLKPSGVVMLNLGDSYISGAPTGKPGWANKYGGGGTDCFRLPEAIQSYGEWTGAKARTGDGEFKKKGMSRVGIKGHPYLKSKDLCLIPFRVAIAAQTDGWWVRSVIIWNKLNPMPESTKDRPTESHEYILMLTRSAHYYWDMEAVKEKATYPDRWGEHNKIYDKTQKESLDKSYAGRNLRSVWEFSTEPFGMEMCKACKIVYQASQYHRLPEKAGGHKCRCADEVEDYIPSWLPVMVEVEWGQVSKPERPKLSIGNMDTRGVPRTRVGLDQPERHQRALTEPDGLFDSTTEQGYQCEYCGAIYTPAEHQALPEARVKICRCGESDFLSHFATFPKELVRRCVLAATSERGNCSKCGKPFVRVTERGELIDVNMGRNLRSHQTGKDFNTKETKSSGLTKGGFIPGHQFETETLGWQPQCRCNAPAEPNLVLDPFSGSGTVGEVAKSLGRKAILIDLSVEYCSLAQRRVEAVPIPMSF